MSILYSSLEPMKKGLEAFNLIETTLKQHPELYKYIFNVKLHIGCVEDDGEEWEIGYWDWFDEHCPQFHPKSKCEGF